jgi:PAS domain S-box-containing protein
MMTRLAVPASYDPSLVALSFLVSIVTAYASLAVFRRVGDARGREWLEWLAGAALVDGVGTWSMHYTGKLALRLPVPVQFDWRLVVLSYLVSVVGSAAALAIIGHHRISWGRAVAAGICLGGFGISGLHYTAMAAMRLPGLEDRYDSPALVTLSIFLAIAISSCALWMIFRAPRPQADTARRDASAVLRGLANPVMHYTAMAAVVFLPSTEARASSHAVSIASLGILGISVVPVMVLIVALLTTMIDRLRTRGALLDELFEEAPQAVALISADDRVVRVNREFTRLFGYTAEEALERRVDELIVPPESREEHQRHADLAHRQRVEWEDVRRRKDGTRVPVSIIRVPVSLPGGEVKIYAIFADITQRRMAEEAERTFLHRSIDVQEAERQRVSRELHDEIGQVLTSARLLLGLAHRLPSDQATARVVEAQSALDGLIEQVRNLALDLRPAMLDDFGLEAALAWLSGRLTAQTGMRISRQESGLIGRRFHPDVEIAAYRIIQEGLTNVARHARVSEVTVRVRVSGETLLVEIEDRGVGFDPEKAQSSAHTVGLAGMRHRASNVGGRLTIETSAGEGTRITAEVPLGGNLDDAGRS